MQSLTPEMTSDSPIEFEATETERQLAVRLAADIENDITHEVYAPLRDKISLYLLHGYKPREVQGELALTGEQMRILRTKIPAEMWEAAEVRSAVHLARKRARLLSEQNPNDLAIVQVLDRDWNPKIEHKITKSSSPLSELPDEELLEMAGL